jgi:hypothetical protein
LPRRASLIWSVVLGGFCGAVGAEAAYTLLGTNFRTVAPGMVFRSARLGPKDLETVVRAHHIRTVVNLTGCCDPLPQYQAESRETAKLGINQEDVGLSATRLPSASAVRELIDVLDRSDYPILIHCHRGIDRTGLASAAALLLHTDVPLDDALAQLSPRYFHIAWAKTGWLDYFFDLYKRWLAGNGLRHSSDAFRRWAREVYCPGPCRASYRLLSPDREPLIAEAGRPAVLKIRCTNTSIETWRMTPDGNTGVHLGWLLATADDQLLSEGRAGLQEARVAPGDAVDLTVALPTMLSPGRYRLRLDMVDEMHAWFYQEGASAPLIVDLEVR